MRFKLLNAQTDTLFKDGKVFTRKTPYVIHVFLTRNTRMIGNLEMPKTTIGQCNNFLLDLPYLFEKCDIDHVTPEMCICLTKRENDSSNSRPELDIKLLCPIKEVNIFSEGSLIEVFGIHDEYLFTCMPEFLDDWEGLAVYHAKIDLPGITSCKLKFSRTREKERLWLYSIQISVAKTEEHPFNNLLFNFENVNKLINNSAHQISEKAEKIKKFLELYAKNSSNSQPLSVQSLLNVINAECNAQLLDCRKTVSDCLNGSRLLNGSDNSKTDGAEPGRQELSVECQFLKGYIDRKFLEMREDVMKCVEVSMAKLREENNAKLDHIIRLLESPKITPKRILWEGQNKKELSGLKEDDCSSLHLL